MATGKKGQSSKKQSQQRARITSSIGLFFKVLLLVVLMVLLGLFALFYLKYGRTILQMQKEAKNYVWSSTEDTFRQYETSLFFDSKGEIISSLSGERELYYVQYEDIPTDIIDAVVTIEDKRFFEHEGVDFIANVRAAVALIQNEGKVTQGGSTITQQLARNIFLSNEVSMERKITEIFIASEMEKKYTKQQILEFYLNNIYYANGYYGIQAAANGYFQKSISELSLSEAAFLCAIPNSPTLYNPLTNIDNTYKRRDKILSQMYEDGLITRKEYKKAIKETVEIKEQSYSSNNYVETYVYQCTIEALMKQEGFTFSYSFSSDEEKEAYNESYQELYNYYQALLYTGGYRVYTSIDLEKQEKLQAALDDNLASFTSVSEEGVFELQGSATCIDNETGNVVAIVGGRSQDFNVYTLNRAYQSYRQPGSAIKPLIVYTPYFEAGHNPDELVKDEKTEDGPKNSNGVYSGEIDIRTAVEQSKNTVAWNLFDELTPQVGLSYIKQMNFKKVTSQDEVLAASLGGFTYGTNTLEMSAAYATLENDGVYREPTCIVRIMDAAGNTILTTKSESKQIYDTQATRIMTDVLTGVLTKGTGKGLGLSNITAAAKTGTTSDKKDGWFAGYTKYYTTTVWVGYDYPKAMSDLYGNTYPGYIWQDYMEEIHKNLEPAEFEPYLDTWSEEEKIEEDTEEAEEAEEPEEDVEEEAEPPTQEPTPEDTEPLPENNGDTDTSENTQDSEEESEGEDETDQEEEDTVETPSTTPTVTQQPSQDNGQGEDSESTSEEEQPEDIEPSIDEEEDFDLDAGSDSEDIYYSDGQVYYKDIDEE